jgi:hypothetical protein
MSGYIDNLVGAYDANVPGTEGTFNLDAFYGGDASTYAYYDSQASYDNSAFSNSTPEINVPATSSGGWDITASGALNYFKDFTGTVLDLGKSYIQLDGAKKGMEAQYRNQQLLADTAAKRDALVAANNDALYNRQLRTINAGNPSMSRMPVSLSSTEMMIAAAAIIFFMMTMGKKA